MLDYVSRMEIFTLDLWNAQEARFIKSVTSETFFWTMRASLKRWEREKRREEKFLARNLPRVLGLGARGENFLNTRQTKLSIQFYLVPDNSWLARHTSSRVRVDGGSRKRARLIPLTFNRDEKKLSNITVPSPLTSIMNGALLKAD